VHFTEQR